MTLKQFKLPCPARFEMQYASGRRRASSKIKTKMKCNKSIIFTHDLRLSVWRKWLFPDIDSSEHWKGCCFKTLLQIHLRSFVPSDATQTSTESTRSFAWLGSISQQLLMRNLCKAGWLCLHKSGFLQMWNILKTKNSVTVFITEYLCSCFALIKTNYLN